MHACTAELAIVPRLGMGTGRSSNCQQGIPPAKKRKGQGRNPRTVTTKAIDCLCLEVKTTNMSTRPGTYRKVDEISAAENHLLLLKHRVRARVMGKRKGVVKGKGKGKGNGR
jgi:hypothetical protein